MITECSGCRLHRHAKTFVFAAGNPESGVVFVGEGPGPRENEEGEPFVGRAGKLLWKMLAEVDIDPSNCYATNVVKCMPSDDGRSFRKPAQDEVDACTSRWTFPELRRLGALRVLVPVGGVAASAILGRQVKITEARGQIFATDFCARTVPIFHPSYLLREGEDPRMMQLTRDDLKLVRSIVTATASGSGAGVVDVAEAVADAKSLQVSDADKARFEQQIIQAPPWRPGRKYVAGWSDERDVVLMYRDPVTLERTLERVPREDSEWYFYMKTEDAARVPRELWQAWRRWECFERIAVDPVSSNWTRVYAVRKVTQTRWLRDRGEVGVGINILDDPRSRKVGGLDTESGQGGKRDREKASIISAQMRQSGMEAARRAMYESGEYRQLDTEYEGGRHKLLGESSKAGGMRTQGKQAKWSGDYRRVDEGFQITARNVRGSDSKGNVGLRDRLQAKDNANWKKYEAEVKLHDFLIELHRYGPTFEADLTPKQRFMTDHLIEIDDRYSELYFDIETDDTVPGWENKESWRHLSYAAVLKLRDGTIERHSFVLSSETDRAERAMLCAFMELVERADILYAWNGFNFDFPILRARCRLHGIEPDWRYVIWCDLLAVWRRYHFRSASAITSFALGDLGSKMLHRDKVDWRAEAARRGKPVDKIIELYRQHPDLLQEYNEGDADLLYDLEQEYGYAGIERVFCRIGNCFTNDYHVSTKVDMLLLNKGSIQGKHFYTRGLQFEALPAYIGERMRSATRTLGAEGEIETEGKRSENVEYTGAYVFPPVVGYHEGVAALDFKSLYPTVMTLFNISPETWVSRDDVPKALLDRPSVEALEAADLTATPSGAFFRKREPGMIPLVFRQTMEKRKVYSSLQLRETVGSDRFLLFYRLSYAYKRLGLSFYGEIGNETSRYFNPEVAEAVTLGGQWFIKRTAELAERRGYRVLAGDTDSLYLKMTEAEAEAFVKECDAYYREIVRPFNVDLSRFMMELEYENYFKNVVFVKKKRYAGHMSIFKGKASDVLEVKGLECMRSDGLEFARTFQREVLKYVTGAAASDAKAAAETSAWVDALGEHLPHRYAAGARTTAGLPPVAAVERIVEATRAKVLSKTLTVADVQATQSIEKSVDEYKTAPPHVRVARHIRDVSTEYFIGMKVPYVMTEAPRDPAKPDRRQPPVAVWAREYVEGTYDAIETWNKKIWPPTLRVLEAAYPGECWQRFLVDTRAPKAPKAEKKPRKKKLLEPAPKEIRSSVIISRRPVALYR